MIVLNWLFTPLLSLIVVSLVLVLAVGAASVHPLHWSATLRTAAEPEVTRRVRGSSRYSQSDSIAKARLLGAAPDQNEGSSEEVVLDAVVTLTDVNDRQQLRNELKRRRDWLEKSALTAQVRMVAQIPSLQTASYVWALGRMLAEVRFACAGFVWFLPKAAPFLAQRLQRHPRKMATAGVVLGILFAGVTHVFKHDATFNWLTIVGNVITAFAVIAFVSAVVALYGAFIVTRFGSPRNWTRRGVIAGLMYAGFVITIMSLVFSGRLAQWELWMTGLIEGTTVGNWVGGALIAALLVYLLRNAVTWIRARRLWISERITTAGIAVFVLLMLLVLACYLLNIPLVEVDQLIMGGAWLMFGLFILAGMVKCIEWTRKLIALRRHRVQVARRGFRWWILLAWIGCGILVSMAQDPVARMQLSPTGQVLGAIFGILYLMWVVAIIPGFIVTILYLRRVNKAYEKLRFDQAPPHPDLASHEAVRATTKEADSGPREI